MRILLDPLLRGGDPHPAQHFHTTGQGIGPADLFVVGTDHLDHLIPDAVDRVEGGHGLLEDHRDLAAPYLAHPGLCSLGQVLPPEQDLTFGVNDAHRRWDQTHDRSCCDAFSAARLAHNAQHPAFLQRKIHAIHCRQQIFIYLKRYLEVSDLQQRLSHLRPPDPTILDLIFSNSLLCFYVAYLQGYWTDQFQLFSLFTPPSKALKPCRRSDLTAKP